MKLSPQDISVKDRIDLTQHEVDALKFTYNLADAHTHQSQSATQKNIVAQLPDLWYQTEQTKQHELDMHFAQAFFAFRNQPSALDGNHHPLLTYASSISIAVVGNYLAQKNFTVALIEPCFDNLHDIFKHLGVHMVRLDEAWLHSEEMYALLEKHLGDVDAIMIVDPNNPTGTSLFSESEGFETLVRFALEKNKLLIFDFCFSLYMTGDPRIKTVDVYKSLRTSGIRFVTIEDTGKIWPTQDVKASILSCSDDLYTDIYNIHSSYLLNVSPFALAVLTAYITDSKQDAFASIASLLKTNREMAVQALAGSILEPQAPQVNVSVLWCKITDPTLDATTLQQILQEAGVYVLPGTYFYWHSPQNGQRYIRIALARDAAMFGAALKLVCRALEACTKRR